MASVESSSTAGSVPPKAATELVYTRRGGLAHFRICARSSSVPCRFTRMPRSKSASAAPLTTAARWNTASVSGGQTLAITFASDTSPVTALSRGSVDAALGNAPSSKVTEARGLPPNCPRASSALASLNPRKPPPPVMSIFMRRF